MPKSKKIKLSGTTHFFSVWIIAWLLFVIVDSLWLGVITAATYGQEIGHLVRMPINLPAALLAWALIVLGLIVITQSMPREKKNVRQGFLYGSLYGFFLYGMYNLTNLAIIDGWTTYISLFDCMWGIALCGGAGALVAWLRDWLA